MLVMNGLAARPVVENHRQITQAVSERQNVLQYFFTINHLAKVEFSYDGTALTIP